MLLSFLQQKFVYRICPTSCYFLPTVKCFWGQFLITTTFCQSTRQTLGSKCGGEGRDLFCTVQVSNNVI
jgi:hypothetical protein